MSTTTATTISIQLTTAPKPRPKDADLVFGRVFTDHMAQIDYDARSDADPDAASGWHHPRVVPYGPLSLDPAAAVLHYAQEMFDGLKAFRGADGKVRLFRVDRHCRRMSEGAARICMPSIDVDLMREALLALVRADAAWVPSSPGTSLYLRPTLIATEPFLGVRPAKRYLFFIIASPVGPYTGDAFAPAKIWVEDQFVRAASGGLGAVKGGANYVASLLAAEEGKKRGFHQVLWTAATHHRYLEEVGTMNMMVRIKDEIVTPPLEGTILGGVTRDSAMTLLRDWGHVVNERPIGMEEIISAHKHGDLREVFGCGTAAVITPVGELGWKTERLVVNGGRPGEAATRL